MHHVVDLDLHPNEASGLVAVHSARLREALSLDPLYWTVLDEGPVEECIALVGQRAATQEPTDDWVTQRLETRVVTAEVDTDDGEAIAWHDGWVYVFGSSYGKKRGPLKAERCFVARFREEDVSVDDSGEVHADLEIAPAPFLLHQIVNDALLESGVILMGFTGRYHKKMLDKARRKAHENEHDWAHRLAAEDAPINIEGASFTTQGSLLLGLRVPCTRYGEALAVEVHHPERLFDAAAGEPEPGRVYVLHGVGGREAPVGIRDLHLDPDNDMLHALIGNLDSSPEKSLLLQEHPEGEIAQSAHVRATFPTIDRDQPGRGELIHLDTELVHEFDGLYRVEGVAADEKGRFLFVSDEDDLVRTHLFTEGPLSVHADPE